ncbi:MAG: helix-turn-helix transcriptional regulator [Clostridia bacterium]|nr:helix-turn-helix transcriptional regulator [Clostridia bacterium]MBQ3928026.1 helix-turn-helix transcriptional regulator [Clostridia bacterium]
MQIGQKIRELRLKENITQAELVGDRLTRNMLSMIENGKVVPSLQTIEYLAARLKVSTGMLFSTGQEEYILKKDRFSQSVKQMFLAGEFEKCLSECDSLGERGSADDEIAWIRAHCLYQLGHKAFLEGQMTEASRLFNQSRVSAERTMFSTDEICSSIDAHFRLIRQLTDGAVTDTYVSMKDSGSDSFLAQDRAWNAFLRAREALSNNDLETVNDFLSEHDADEDIWTELIRAELAVYDGDYRSGRMILDRILSREADIKPVIKYYLLEDLEICCREIDDFKGAYLASKERLELSELFQSTK